MSDTSREGRSPQRIEEIEGGDPRTFEQLMDALEAATERLATGELGIEAAAELYERAERLHALAAERLAQVQARVEALSRRDGGVV